MLSTLFSRFYNGPQSVKQFLDIRNPTSSIYMYYWTFNRLKFTKKSNTNEFIALRRLFNVVKFSLAFPTVLLIAYRKNILIHLRQSISSVLKCFSQTYSSPASIWRHKLLSTTRSLVITFSQASRVAIETSSFPDGILKIPTPVCFLLDPQPNIEQLAPGIVEKVAKL